MKHADEMSLTEEMCQDFLTVLFAFKHDLISIAEVQGLTIMQLYALVEIKRTGDMSMGKMAQLLHCDASNVTGIIDRLVTKKLLIREENINDRREKILKTTMSGAELVTQCLSSLPERLGSGRLSNNELATLNGILKKISASA
jgi:DNA-binding MarR family transcriptional regulator